MFSDRTNPKHARPRRWDARLAWLFARRTLESFQHGRLELVCPEQTYFGGNPEEGPGATIVVHDKRFFSRVLWREEIGMGESYVDGDWSSPDLVAVARFAIRNVGELNRRNRFTSALHRWRMRLVHSLRANTPRGSRKNIHYHYDLSNEFFGLFLDPTMAYSCAHFTSGEDSLEKAQLAKYDRICRKLMLQPDDHLLEIGTGWGGLALHAAKHYGCRVTATTISRDQHDYARDLFQHSGLLGSRLELLSQDYRELRGQYDKLVSVEMFEAVGYAHYDEFFAVCDRLLTRHGSMLLQTITVPDQRFAEYLEYADWIQTYIFPGSELSAVGEIMNSIARATHLELHHAEEIGQHYARTIALWRERFRRAEQQVRALGFDDRFIRMWEYYLAICEASFLERSTGNVQLVLAKAGTRKPLWGEPQKKAEVVELEMAEEPVESAAAEQAEGQWPGAGAPQSVPGKVSRAGTIQPSGFTTPFTQ